MACCSDSNKIDALYKYSGDNRTGPLILAVSYRGGLLQKGSMLTRLIV